MKLGKYISAAAIAGAMTVLGSTPAKADDHTVETIFRVLVESQRHHTERGPRAGEKVEELYRNGVNQIGWNNLDAAERNADEIREIEYRTGMRTDYDERLADSIAEAHYRNGTNQVGWNNLDAAESQAREVRKLERKFDIETDYDSKLYTSIADANYRNGINQVGWNNLDAAEKSLGNVLQMERRARFSRAHDDDNAGYDRDRWRDERNESLSTRLLDSIIDAYYRNGINQVGWNNLDAARNSLREINRLEDQFRYNSNKDEQLMHAIRERSHRRY